MPNKRARPTPQSPQILDRQRTVGYVSETPSSREVRQASREQARAPYYSVEFYPEGVVGLPSKVAYQVRGRDGELLAVSCRVVGGRGGEIESESQHLGIGTFEITPSGGEYYMLIEGDKTKHKLPKPLDTQYPIAWERASTRPLIRRNDPTTRELR